MKNIRNKKGFTLIEVIATVIILGLTLTAAIVGYNKYIKESKNTYYTKQKDLVTQAGRDFFNDNRGRLPVNVSEESCVLLSTLIKNNYIDEVVGYDKKACNAEGSKVCAQKISLTKYKYVTTLDCGEEEEVAVGNPPVISFSLKNTTKNKIEDDDFKKGDTHTGATDNLYSVNIKITSDTNIGSYNYYVHQIKSGSDKVVRSKKGISVPDGTKEYTISVPLNSSGTFYIETKVFNEKSNDTSTSGKVTLTITKPNCETAINFDENGSDWTNDNISTNISISDSFKLNYYYLELVDSKTNKTIETVKVNDSSKITSKNFEHVNSVEDNKSRQAYYKLVTYDDELNDTCTVKSNTYKIDKVKPTCTVTSSSNTWTNDKVTVNVTCIDRESGCVKDNDSVEITEEYDDYYTTEISDKAGNKNTCTTTDKILIDKHSPGASITSTNNVASSQTVTLNMTDDKGLDKYYFGTIDPEGPNKGNITYTSIPGDVKTYNTNATVSENGKYYLSVLDKAGNVKNINKVFYKTTLSPGEGTVDPSTIITMSGNSFEIPNPTANSGKDFSGWYLESTLSMVASSPYKPTDNLTLYAKWTNNEYSISYKMNGGPNPSSMPSTAAYNTDVQITNPSKKSVVISIDQNFYLYDNAGVTYKGKVRKTDEDDLSEAIRFDQSFSGWTSTTLGENAKIGNTSGSTPSTNWTGTSTKYKYFRNLRDSGTVTMIANWNEATVTLPDIEKFGYECTYNTKSNGTGTEYIPGDDYTHPSDGATSLTLYPVCKAENFTVIYAANRENYLMNYTFTNTTKVTGTDDACGTNSCVCKDDSSLNVNKSISTYLQYNKAASGDGYLYHINEWPVYDTCTVSGYDLNHPEYKYYAHLAKDSDSSHGNVVAFPIGDSSNDPNNLDFNFQLSNVLEQNKLYVLSFDIKKSSSDDIVLKTGIRSGEDRSILYSAPLDMDKNDGTSFEADSTSEWTTKTYVFRVGANYERYVDNFSGGYKSTGDNQEDHINSGRPELFFSYDIDDENSKDSNNNYKKGTIYIDNIRLYGADSTLMEYDSSFNDNPPPTDTIRKNGYLFAGWYKNMDSALALTQANQIIATNNTLNKDTLTCDSYYDKNKDKYNTCYLYAGWYEKEYKLNLSGLPSGASQSTSNIVKFSDVTFMKDSSNKPVYIKNGQLFKGWNEWTEKTSLTTNNDPFMLKLDNADSVGSDKCDGISSYGYNKNDNSPSLESKYNSCGYDTSNGNKPTLRFDVREDTSAPYTDNRITLNNDTFPNFAHPGFGGYCQSLSSNLDPNKEYVHVIIAGMGDGLYLHYTENDKSLENTSWLTSNEGRAAMKMYVYKFKPSESKNNICVYFSQRYDEDITAFERQHMSANLYLSGVYEASDASSFLGQTCSDNNCSDANGCCQKTWTAGWKEKPLRVYYKAGDAEPLSGSSYRVNSSDYITLHNSVYYDEFNGGSSVTITKHPTNTFKIGISGYSATTNAEWGSAVKLNTAYSWSTIKSKATDAGDYYKITLTANWTANSSICTITYNANGGSVSPIKQTYTCSVDATGTITLATPTRTGYTFNYWVYNNNHYNGGSSWNKRNTGNYTLTANWTAINYKITYNANGGSGAPGQTSYTYAANSYVKLSTTKPTRSGYTFLGWSQSSSATSASYQPGQNWSRANAGNYTLYAVWKKNAQYCQQNNWSCTYYYCTVGDRYETYLSTSGGGCSTGYTFHKYSGNTNSGYCSCDTAKCGSWVNNITYYVCG